MTATSAAGEAGPPADLTTAGTHRVAPFVYRIPLPGDGLLAVNVDR